MHEIGETPLRYSGYAPQTPASGALASGAHVGSAASVPLSAPHFPQAAAQYLESPRSVPRTMSAYQFGVHTEPRQPKMAPSLGVTSSHEIYTPSAYARGGSDAVQRQLATGNYDTNTPSAIARGGSDAASRQLTVEALQQEHLMHDQESLRETCEFNVVKVCRVVTFFCRQLQALTESRVMFEPTLQHVRDLSTALLAEVRGVVACVSPEAGSLADIPGIAEGTPLQLPLPAPPPLPSLSSPNPRALVSIYSSPASAVMEDISHLDLQRRCEGMHADLLRQVHTNEELVGSLKSAEEMNMKLQEQVRQQSEDILTLTRQRREADERLEDMERTRRLENDLTEKDARRRMLSLQEAADVKCQLVRSTLAEQLRTTQARLDQVRKDCSRLRMDQLDQKRAVQESCQAMRHFLEGAEDGILQRLQGFLKRQHVLEVSSLDRTHDLEAQLAAEQELRVSEASSWSHRHALLGAERDDLQTRMACEISDLTDQLQATQQSLEHAERLHDADRSAWVDQRTSLELALQRQREEAARNLTACEAAHEQLRREAAESHRALTDLRSVIEEERGASRQGSAELTLQLRAEAQEAVAAAKDAAQLASERAAKEAAGREEALKEQLVEQRRCLADAGDRAMASCLEACEQRLGRTVEESQADVARATASARAAEERLHVVEGELQQAHQQVAHKTELSDHRHSEMSDSKTELLEEGKRLQSSQSELSRIRQELAEERGHHQDVIKEFQARRDTLEAECKATQERLLEAMRVSADSDARQTQAAAELEAGLRQRDATLEECERRLAGARNEATTATAEMRNHQLHLSEVQAALEKAMAEAADERSCLEAERQQLQAAKLTEAVMAREGSKQQERWQEAHVESLQQARGLVQAFTKLQAETHALEDCGLDMSTMDERHIYQDELTDAAQKIAEMRGKLEAIESEGLNTKQLLKDSRCSLDQTRRECLREEQAAAAAETALKSATSNEAALTRQLEESTAQHLQESLKLKQEIAALQCGRDQQVAQADQRMRTLESDLEARLLAAEAQHRSQADHELQRERDRAESVLQENLKLRRAVAEQRRGANAGMNALQMQLETHIARLQQQTDSLSPRARSPGAASAMGHTIGSSAGNTLRGMVGGLTTARIGTIGST